MKGIATLAAAATLALGMVGADAQSSQQPLGGGGGIKEGTSSQEGGGQTNPSRGFVPELNSGRGSMPQTGGTIVAPAERDATTGSGERPGGMMGAPGNPQR